MAILKMMSQLRRLIRKEEAATVVEYAVMLALIIVVCVVSISALGESVYDALWDAADALEE